MAKKKTVFQRGEGKAFYPPQGSLSYVYLTSLQGEDSEEAKNLSAWAAGTIPSIANSFSAEGILTTAYSSLSGLIQTERDAENQFLSTQLKLSLEEVQSYGIKKLIDSFNKILNLESTYQQNVSRVKSMEEKNIQGYIDRLYSVANYELPKAIESFIESKLSSWETSEQLMSGQYDEEIKQEAAECLTKKIHQIYAEGTDADKRYSEFAQMMRNITSSDPLIGNLMRNYGIMPEQLRTSIEQKRKVNKKVTPQNVYLQRRGGNIFEDFVQQVLNSVTAGKGGISFNTAAFNNMKADHTIMYGINNGESLLKSVNKDLVVDTDSTRLKNIELFERFFNQIEKAKSSIVFISDKNYNLKAKTFADLKGFGAENPTLQNLGGVLAKANIGRVDEIVFALANTGPRRFNNSAASIERYLATKIANFLFDDVVITDQLDNNISSVSRIHVFNLGGIYVPLSVFLQGVYNSLTSLHGDYTEYVNVKYHATGIPYTEQTDGLTEGDWNQLYNHVISKSHVSMHFFGNFIDFISANL